MGIEDASSGGLAFALAKASSVGDGGITDGEALFGLA